jgi:hypothetical protein
VADVGAEPAAMSGAIIRVYFSGKGTVKPK